MEKAPTERASEVISGWINAYVPAFESKRDDLSPRILRTAARHGFTEVYSLADVKRQRESSWGRWLALRREAHRNHEGVRMEREITAAPPAQVDPGAWTSPGARLFFSPFQIAKPFHEIAAPLQADVGHTPDLAST